MSDRLLICDILFSMRDLLAIIYAVASVSTLDRFAKEGEMGLWHHR